MNDAVTPELLKSLAFLSPATDEELRRLAPTARAEQFPAGTVLFREGDHLPHVFVVTAGTVALEICGADHRPRRFQTVGPGELLGWSPLLGAGPMTASARALAQRVLRAGALFIGGSTPEAAGDYMAGPSHVLPTGGAARYAAPLGVYDFVSRSSLIEYTPQALAEQAQDICTFARAEGLEAHARAVEVRGESDRKAR